MKKMFLLFAVLVVFAFCFTDYATAADLPRVMLAGEDVDQDTIPRGSRVFKRVMEEISNKLIEEGFDVKDETALTHKTHEQGRVRRNDEELIIIAKDAGVDVLVIFSIYPRVDVDATTARVAVRIEGRLLEVNTGSKLGTFENEPQKSQPLNRPYTRDDILEGAGKLAKIVASEVGLNLKGRLASLHDARGGRVVEYTLIFDNFSDSEMASVEDYLKMFSGYDTHRPKSNATNTGTHYEFWYKSSIDSAKLRSNLVKAMDKLNMQGNVSFSGAEFVVKKLAQIKDRRRQQNSEW
ncbi:MAG: hypothetical protein EPN22_01505 [Nitrospirae bacterium]|nr:MAG: hypothetical protein EPN22_01505 [Nitrospirota bacterium]